MKRIHYSRRKLVALIIQVLVVLLLVIWAIIICNDDRKAVIDKPALKIAIAAYETPTIAFDTYEKDWKQAFEEVVGDAGKEVPDVEEYFNSVLKKDFGSYIGYHIAGAKLKRYGHQVYYSQNYIHTRPLAININSNTILRHSNTTVSIQVTNHPLSTGRKAFDKGEKVAADTILNKIQFPNKFATLTLMALSILSALMVLFPVEEKTSKAKHLQLTTGVDVSLFWFTSFLFDFITLTVICCLILCCFPIFEIATIFTSHHGILALIVILLVFIFSSICFAYFVSLFVATPTGGFSLIVITNLLLGLWFGMLVPFVEYNGANDVAMTATWIGRIFPFYGVAISLFRYAEIVARNSRCILFPKDTLQSYCNSHPFGSTCCSCPPELENYVSTFTRNMTAEPCFRIHKYLVWSTDWFVKYSFELNTNEWNWLTIPGIGQELFFSFLISLVYLAFVLCYDYGLFKLIISFSRGSGSSSKRQPDAFAYADQDEDVKQESQRVRDELTNGKVTDAVAMVGISKIFSGFTAVSGLTFGVYQGECFGLLGINGAGKTTAFRILTGDVVVNAGNAYMSDCSLQKKRTKFVSRIGYCPQFDAVLGSLSGMEMLQLMSRLRGDKYSKIEANTWLARVGLGDSARVQVQNYSGGMKRRLSTAMAMIGDPPIVMLDEPTSGVDPVARRQFWDIIRFSRASGQSIILTSHSMDECEALCSRLGLMVNGQFQCFGGIEHIKHKYAQGFTYTIKLKPTIPQDAPGIEYLKNEIQEKFQPCFLKDHHMNILQYQINKIDLPWGKLFEETEYLNNRYVEYIENYSVTATTLDDVFLAFARMQYPAREGTTKCCSC